MDLGPHMRELGTIRVPDDYVGDCCFSNDGRLLAQLYRGGYKLYAVPDGSMIAEQRPFFDFVEAVAISPANECIALGSTRHGDAKVLLVELGPSGALSERPLRREANRLSFDGRGERLLCSNRSRGAWIVNARSGDDVAFLKAGDAFISDAALLSEGDRVVGVTSDGRLVLWSIGSPSPIADCEVAGGWESAQAVAVSPDETFAAVLSDSSISLVRISGGSATVTWCTKPARPISWPEWDGVLPPPTFGWVDPEHFAMLINEQAPKGPYVFRSEAFLYLFSARSDRWVARCPIEATYARIATAAACANLALATAGAVQILEFSPRA